MLCRDLLRGMVLRLAFAPHFLICGYLARSVSQEASLEYMPQKSSTDTANPCTLSVRRIKVVTHAAIAQDEQQLMVRRQVNRVMTTCDDDLRREALDTLTYCSYT